MQNPWLLMADDEFYTPVRPGSGAPTTPLTPAGLPSGWSGHDHSVWRHWSPPAGPGAEQGWKVHVSAVPQRLAEVLDRVAAACFALDVAFKHLGSADYFLMLHQKHSSRVQAGKFCAAYPGDAHTARLLMERLTLDLADEEGAYVLTDRRFGPSKVVHYRYGAFTRRERLRLDGTSEPLVRDAEGNDVPDERRPSFVLPAGIEDPFLGNRPPRGPARGGPALLNDRFQVQEAIRHSNGGGTYQALDTRTGATVFVKEARARNGYGADWTDARERLRQEHRSLRTVHEQAPGVCPEPLDYFGHWEHEFLVTEFVPGHPLFRWSAVHQVLPQLDTDPRRRAEYLARVERLLDSLRSALDRLHAIGLRFGDLSHGNVLVQDDDTVRLIDFETATALSEPPVQLGTIGYAAPAELLAAGVDGDEYGFSALAMLLLFPLARPLQVDPVGRLELHRRDLDRHLPIPERLWEQATRFYRPGSGATTAAPAVPDTPFPLPTAAELDARPLASLTALGDGLAAGLVAMARPEQADWVFPPGPDGYAANTHCLAHGTAGVLHALHHWGAAVPEEILTRFRRDALAAADALPPGLQAGAAGLAWTLAELGRPEEAELLLDHAQRHPLLARSALLGHGSAGVGMARLLLHRLHGDPGQLKAAASIADALLGTGLDALDAEAGTPGLDQGRSGVALFLHELGRDTGEHRYHAAARRLVHAELDQAEDCGEDGLRFNDGGGRRVITYLTIGSAGVATALTRLAADLGDERCATALPRVLVPCRATSSVEPGLYTGVGSWAYAHAEHADHAGGPDDRATAVRIATSLAKYTVRFGGGLRVLGSFEPRYHADLATGSAGVLLALARVVKGPPASLFLPDV
ncbi:class III lanthionine synthetase LanKC [Streptacidiphilus cavernicola]|uniref:Class III lanthionine synthetase LanKC n=1 Tax=Streptacidiphilus cavernicola TaxID=3342716 RepID=A0ABV6VZE8_9ACTN